jgi:hypothetical protein
MPPDLTAEERDTALLTLAAYGGNAAAASRALKEQGIRVPERTLRGWRARTYTERYIELAHEHARAIEQVAETRMRETLLRASDLTMEALEAASQQIAKGEARDPSAVARNAAVIVGINAEKNLLYQGRPNVITQHDSAEDILRRLQSKHPGMFIEGSAEEISTPVGELARRKGLD